MHANWPHKINDQINRKRQGLPDAGCQRGATAILLLVCMLSLFSTNCPNNIVLFACCGLTGFLGRISPCFQYSVQSLGRDRFRFISPYTTAHLDKRQKIFPHTDIVLHSANTSEIPATKKPHNYHKIAVWQKDDRIRKSPLKFCVYHYNELEGDCQAAIITELCRREKLYLSTCLLIHIKVHRSKSPR